MTYRIALFFTANYETFACQELSPSPLIVSHCFFFLIYAYCILFENEYIQFELPIRFDVTTERIIKQCELERTKHTHTHCHAHKHNVNLLL